ncbi:MAG: hypothetical protein LQ344_000932 [Seirophora lacunosa]|nr:MAG: hypothetical protein LQ344_000932 [Seirophora lacunosa]
MIVKDVVRDVIDGQPKKGDFGMDGESRWVFVCVMFSRDDALQAYEALAGRNWYDLAGGTGEPSIMKVACKQVRRGQRDCRPIAGPTDVPVKSNAARSAKDSSRNQHCANPGTPEWSPSTSSNMQIPLSPVAVNYGFRAPAFGAGFQSQAPMAMPNTVAVSQANSISGMNLAAAGMGSPYLQNMVGRSGFRPEPPDALQARTTLSRTTYRQPAGHPINRRVMIHNLQYQVTEHMLKQKLTESIGGVKGCWFETRDGRRCVAFVTFDQVEQAQRAIDIWDHRPFFGREITVRFTTDGEGGPVIVDGST